MIPVTLLGPALGRGGRSRCYIKKSLRSRLGRFSTMLSTRSVISWVMFFTTRMAPMICLVCSRRPDTGFGYVKTVAVRS